MFSLMHIKEEELPDEVIFSFNIQIPPRRYDGFPPQAAKMNNNKRTENIKKCLVDVVAALPTLPAFFFGKIFSFSFAQKLYC